MNPTEQQPPRPARSVYRPWECFVAGATAPPGLAYGWALGRPDVQTYEFGHGRVPSYPHVTDAAAVLCAVGVGLREAAARAKGLAAPGEYVGLVVRTDNADVYDWLWDRRKAIKAYDPLLDRINAVWRELCGTRAIVVPELIGRDENVAAWKQVEMELAKGAKAA